MQNKTQINRVIKMVAQISIDKASQVLSKLIKAGAQIKMQDAYIADISSVTQRVSSENTEAVAAVVELLGDAHFKFLFFVRTQDSLTLADLMMRKEAGTTKEFNVFASSAVQEIGNIMASAIAGVFSTDFGINIQAQPPVVIHDYAGTTFQEFLMSSIDEKNEIMIVESQFMVIKNDIECFMFLLPLGDSEKILSYMANTF